MDSAHKHDEPKAPPKWASQPFRIFKQRLDEEMKFLHLARKGLLGLRYLPQMLDVFGPAEGDEPDGNLKHASRLERAKHDAAWVSTEAVRDFPLLHAHSVVGIWSTLEVLSEDFALAWLTNVPSAWDVEEITKLKLPIGKYHQSTPEQRARWVVTEASRNRSADLKKGIGKLSSVLDVFGLAPSIGANARRALHEMCEVRNVFVHCGGVADQRLVDDCPWLGLKTGELVVVSHEVFGWYGTAATTFSERVYNQLLIALKLPSCECPGVDEIPARPFAKGEERAKGAHE